MYILKIDQPLQTNGITTRVKVVLCGSALSTLCLVHFIYISGRPIRVSEVESIPLYILVFQDLPRGTSITSCSNLARSHLSNVIVLLRGGLHVGAHSVLSTLSRRFFIWYHFVARRLLTRCMLMSLEEVPLRCDCSTYIILHEVAPCFYVAR